MQFEATVMTVWTVVSVAFSWSHVILLHVEPSLYSVQSVGWCGLWFAQSFTLSEAVIV